MRATSELPTRSGRPDRSRAFLVAVGLMAFGPAIARAEAPPGPAGPRLKIDHGFGAGVAFSPDGKWLASGREDGTVALFAVADLGPSAKPRSLGVPDDQFSKYRPAPGPIRFSPDGATLVAGNFPAPIDLRDHRTVGPDALRAWDLATGKVLYTVPLDGLGRTFAITADGRTLRASVRKDGKTELIQSWDLKTGSPAGTVPLAHRGTNATAFTPDGARLAVIEPEAATITLHEIPSGRAGEILDDPSLRGDPRSFVDLAFAPDGRTLAALRGDNYVLIQDVATGAARATIAPPADAAKTYPFRMAFSADGRRLVLVGAHPIPHRPREVAFAGRVAVADLADVVWDARLAIVEGMPVGCNDLSLSPDGRSLAITNTVFPGSVPQGALSVWDLPPRR